MADTVRPLLDPLAESRAQLDQLPPRLKKAMEQMMWRAKAAKGPSSKRGKAVIIGPCPRHSPLFVLPPASRRDQPPIPKPKSALAQFWKRISRK